MVMIARLDKRSWPPMSAAAKLHVLLLDEAPASRSETRRLLGEAGITKISDGVVSGHDISARNCDLRMVDVILSEMDLRGGWGLDLLKRIRLGQARQFRPDVCFIFMTGATIPALVVTAAHLDANGYLSKPIAPDRLRAAILRGVGRNCLVNFAKYRDVPIGLGPPTVH